MKESPYNLFKKWLFTNSDSSLEDDVLKCVNPISVLNMLCLGGELTIFLNDIFNTYDIMTREFKEATNDLKEFYQFIKESVNRSKLSKYSFSYFSKTKKDKTIIEISKLLPLLKIEEIRFLLDVCKGTDEYDELMDLAGLNKISKTKIKKGKKGKTDVVWTFKKWKRELSGGSC